MSNAKLFSVYEPHKNVRKNFAVAMVLLCACCSMVHAENRIPSVSVAAITENTKRVMVVVMPGHGDDIADLQASGITNAIYQAMPDADLGGVGRDDY